MNAYGHRLALMSILERIRPLEGCGNNRVEGVARKLEMLIDESRLEPGTLFGTKKGLRGRVKSHQAR
jgi:hypothetical protein